MKAKIEPPKPPPRKAYVRMPPVKAKKGEGIDMETQTDRSYVFELKAKKAEEHRMIAERIRLSNQKD